MEKNRVAHLAASWEAASEEMVRERKWEEMERETELLALFPS